MNRTERYLRFREAEREVYGGQDPFAAKISFSKSRAKRGGYLAMDVTPAELKAALIEQDNRCAICGKRGSEDPISRKGLCADHSHETGKFRGWLCNYCNAQLLPFFDSPLATRLWTCWWGYPEPEKWRILMEDGPICARIREYLG